MPMPQFDSKDKTLDTEHYVENIEAPAPKAVKKVFYSYENMEPEAVTEIKKLQKTLEDYIDPFMSKIQMPEAKSGKIDGIQALEFLSGDDKHLKTPLKASLTLIKQLHKHLGDFQEATADVYNQEKGGMEEPAFNKALKTLQSNCRASIFNNQNDIKADQTLWNRIKAYIHKIIYRYVGKDVKFIEYTQSTFFRKMKPNTQSLLEKVRDFDKEPTALSEEKTNNDSQNEEDHTDGIHGFSVAI